MYRVMAIATIAVMMMFAPYVAAVEPQVGLRMILVNDPKEARSILQQLQQGTSFSALARAKSIGPPGRQWGMLGLVRPDDVQEPIRSALKTLKVGQMSDVIPTANHYAIVKLISPEIPRLLGQAEQALRHGKPTDAVKLIQSALRFEPDNVPAYMLLGMAYSQAGQLNQGLKALDKARDYAPQEGKIAMLQATIYGNMALKDNSRAQGRKALKAYEHVLSLDKRYTTVVHLSMGNLYYMVLKQPQKAIHHLEKAAAGNPDVALVHELLIQAYYDQKHYPQAWKQLRLAQGRGFEFPKLLEQLHQVKQQSKK